MKPIDFFRQSICAFSVEAIGDQEYNSALTEYPAGPIPIKFVKALSDPCSAGPINDRFGNFIQGYIYIPISQVSCDICKPCSEQKRMHAIAIIGDCMQEMK